MDQTNITVCPRRLLIITIPGEIVVVPSGPAVAGGMDITIIKMDIERTVDITSSCQLDAAHPFASVGVVLWPRVGGSAV